MEAHVSFRVKFKLVEAVKVRGYSGSDSLGRQYRFGPDTTFRLPFKRILMGRKDNPG